MKTEVWAGVIKKAFVCSLLVPHPIRLGMEGWTDGRMDRLMGGWTRAKQCWTGMAHQTCSVAPPQEKTAWYTHFRVEFAQVLLWLVKERYDVKLSLSLVSVPVFCPQTSVCREKQPKDDEWGAPGRKCTVRRRHTHTHTHKHTHTHIHGCMSRQLCICFCVCVHVWL